jgi:hypothetical protein
VDLQIASENIIKKPNNIVGGVTEQVQEQKIWVGESIII